VEAHEVSPHAVYKRLACTKQLQTESPVATHKKKGNTMYPLLILKYFDANIS